MRVQYNVVKMLIKQELVKSSQSSLSSPCMQLQKVMVSTSGVLDSDQRHTLWSLFSVRRENIVVGGRNIHLSLD